MLTPKNSATAEVLVIEDDPSLRELLIETLRKHGRTAAGVSGGKEAIRYLQEAAKLPRLIFLDLHMEQGDGLAFRQQQVKKPDWAAVPVLIITGDSDVFNKVDSLRAAGYLRKPFEVDPLLEMVDRLLG